MKVGYLLQYSKPFFAHWILDCSDFCPGSTASKYFMLPPFTINGDFIPDNIEFLKRLIGNNLHKAGNKNSIFHCSRATGDIET